ncbi:hypothetical protein F751_3922 [Auxenochlorella protothecoides]|uniref:Uncharacterized protein n=1 Tax=Auxenochlorella protothecoides TaxID=3075 RepID=A0A087SHN8_AUXPR|nr:hypothetical protein F751_3922 [Auxenochlorella protothecoides]KFM25242.1 hypothetical protein F751_3922 [Auxenochlorella protothecoides]
MSGYGRNDDNTGVGGYNQVHTETYDKEHRSSGGSGLDNLKEKEHGHQRASHVASDPVYGATDAHKSGVGAKAESALHGVKAKIPGTQEHKLTQEGGRPYEGIRGEADLAAGTGGAGYQRNEAPVHGGHLHHEGAGSGAGYTRTAATHGHDDLGAGSGNREAGYHGAGAGYDNEVTHGSAGERGHDEGGQSKLGQVFEKVKAAIPGTAENKEKKAFEGRY